MTIQNVLKKAIEDTLPMLLLEPFSDDDLSNRSKTKEFSIDKDIDCR